MFSKEKKKHLYYVDDTPENFFILSNKNKKNNFALYKTEFTKTSEINWKIQVSHKRNEIIEDFICFKDFIILETRKNGLSQLIQFDRKTKKKSYIEFKDEAYTVNLTNNYEYTDNKFCFIYSSLNSPSSYFFSKLIFKKKN